MEQHHVLPRRFGGSDREENLVTLCGSCHRAVEDIYDKRFWTSVGLRPSDESHTVKEFVDRRLSFDESYGATPKSDVYQWYADWCRGGDIKPVSQQKFTQKLKRLPAVKTGRAYVDDEQYRCFFGVAEKPLIDAD
jgi:hypothetical protein